MDTRSDRQFSARGLSQRGCSWGLRESAYHYLRYKIIRKNEIHVYKQIKVNTSSNRLFEYEELELAKVERFKEYFGICFNSFV